jgi:hypothetical protein
MILIIIVKEYKVFLGLLFVVVTSISSPKLVMSLSSTTA